MPAPVSDDVPCFDSLPDDLVGVIMGRLDFPSALRLTQACPAARRLVQGERAVPGVLGKVSVQLPRAVDERNLRVAVQKSGFMIREVKAAPGMEIEAAAAGESHAKRQPSACIVHLLEWIRVRARAFAEIVVETSTQREIVLHLADTFLPNVPSSYRGTISFEFSSSNTGSELEIVTNFLAAWRALSPAYECGLRVGRRKAPSDLLRASLQAAPPLSSLTVPDIEGRVPGFKFLESLDTSRLAMLDIRCWTLDSLPSEDVLPPTLRNLCMRIDPRCWSSLDAFLAPLHRLTALKLSVGSPDEQLNSSLTLAPFAVLPNLRVLGITAFEYFGPPPAGSKYWKESVVLPALEELFLLQLYDADAQGGEAGPAASQPSRWPTLLSNLEAPKLERLRYTHVLEKVDYDSALDLPLGRFPRLRYFDVHADANLDLPALRAEVATLRHLERPGSGGFFGVRRSVPQGFTIPNDQPSEIRYPPKEPLPEDEVAAWEVGLGFYVSRSGGQVILEACGVPMVLSEPWPVSLS